MVRSTDARHTKLDARAGLADKRMLRACTLMLMLPITVMLAIQAPAAWKTKWTNRSVLTSWKPFVTDLALVAPIL